MGGRSIALRLLYAHVAAPLGLQLSSVVEVPQVHALRELAARHLQLGALVVLPYLLRHLHCARQLLVAILGLLISEVRARSALASLRGYASLG